MNSINLIISIMKRILLISSSILILFTATGFVLSSNGIAGQTGSPGEGTCASCHSGGAGTTSVSINATPSFTAGQYLPGQTYTIEITVANAAFSKFGFGCEILSGPNTNSGTMQNGGTGVVFANSGTKKNAIHNVPKTGTGSATFTFEWIAPLSGNATIYAAGNAANGNNNTSGDRGGNTSLALTALGTDLNENENVSAISVYPNPSQSEINVRFHIQKSSDVKLAVFDLSGKEVAVLSNQAQESGDYNLNYSLNSDLESGVYILKLFINEGLHTQKLFIKR